MSRRTAREQAMKLLYQMEIQKDGKQEQLAHFFEENPADENDKLYIEEVVNGVTDNASSLDILIEKYAKGWTLSRISRIDLSLLRLSIYELQFREDIPLNVSVNEAIELAKKYSGEDAGAFINGILGNYIKSEKEGKD